MQAALVRKAFLICGVFRSAQRLKSHPEASLRLLSGKNHRCRRSAGYYRCRICLQHPRPLPVDRKTARPTERLWAVCRFQLVFCSKKSSPMGIVTRGRRNKHTFTEVLRKSFGFLPHLPKLFPRRCRRLPEIRRERAVRTALLHARNAFCGAFRLSSARSAWKF